MASRITTQLSADKVEEYARAMVLFGSVGAWYWMSGRSPRFALGSLVLVPAFYTAQRYRKDSDLTFETGVVSLAALAAPLSQHAYYWLKLRGPELLPQRRAVVGLGLAGVGAIAADLHRQQLLHDIARWKRLPVIGQLIESYTTPKAKVSQ